MRDRAGLQAHEEGVAEDAAPGGVQENARRHLQEEGRDRKGEEEDGGGERQAGRE